MSNRLSLEREVLSILAARTKIHARSAEEIKQDGRGRPKIEILET